MIIQEHDVVKLKDGREGTVVHIHTVPRTAYLIETDDPVEDWPTVELAEIKEIIWTQPTA